MRFFERVKKDGISLKTTHSLMILIQLKTDLINRHLADTSDGVPNISLSVGVAFGSDSGDKDIDQLIQCADEALYQMKAAG